jgi:hypothetical protein
MGTSKYIKVSAPKTINDLRIRHVEVLTNPKFQKSFDIELMIEFVSLITGAKLSDLRKAYISNIEDVYKHCITLFNDYKPMKPKEQIIVNGQLFDLVNPSKVGIGWHIDVSNSDFTKQPEKLVAMMYVEHGTTYGELDENKNMKHPNSVRMELFKEHLPLPIYLNCVDFFLRQSLKSMNKFMENKMKRVRIKGTLSNLMFGSN